MFFLPMPPSFASIYICCTWRKSTKAPRQPFELDGLSDKQYPAVIVQTSEETREDAQLGSGAKTRLCSIDFVILGLVKGIKRFYKGCSHIFLNNYENLKSVNFMKLMQISKNSTISTPSLAGVLVSLAFTKLLVSPSVISTTSSHSIG